MSGFFQRTRFSDFDRSVEKFEATQNQVFELIGVRHLRRVVFGQFANFGDFAMHLGFRGFILRKVGGVSGVQIVSAVAGCEGERSLNIAERHLNIVGMRDPLGAFDQLNYGDGGGGAANEQEAQRGGKSQARLLSGRHGRQVHGTPRFITTWRSFRKT